MSDIAVWNGRPIEIDISDLMAVVAIDRPADIPSIEGIKSDIKRHASVSTPVAVDILRSGNASAGRLIVSHHIADGVAGL